MARKPHRSPWHPTRDQMKFLIETHTTLTAVEQAAQLRKDYDAVCYQRQRLLRAGVIAREDRKYARPYTPDDDREIRALIADGQTVAQIAKALERPLGSLRSHITEDLGGVSTLRGEIGSMVRTTTELGQLFGLNKATISKWIKRRWLKATRNEVFKTRNKQRPMLVTDADLMDFRRQRDYWPAWTPATITDPLWQTYAEDLRAQAGGEWIGAAVLARDLDVPIARLYAWFRQGKLNELTTLRYGVEYFLWSADVEQLRARIHRTSCQVWLRPGPSANAAYD